MRPLDRTDAEILRQLQKNARLPNKALAARVGLAPSSCLVRVRRLQEDGYFRGFHAHLDHHAIGIGVEALVSVSLSRHARSQVEGFRAHALSLPEVVAFYHVTGEADFLLHVAVRDLDHLRELALSAFTTREEVARIETSVVYEHAANPVLPIYAEEDPEA